MSWPLAYSANVSIGRATTPPPEDIIWCGDAMPHGGIRTITIRYVDWATDEYLLNWMELTMADGALATLFPGRLTLSLLRVYARVWTSHPRLLVSKRCHGHKHSRMHLCLELTYMLVIVATSSPTGTKSCGEFGSYTYPETGNPPTKTHNLTMTLR